MKTANRKQALTELMREEWFWLQAIRCSRNAERVDDSAALCVEAMRKQGISEQAINDLCSLPQVIVVRGEQGRGKTTHVNELRCLLPSGQLNIVFDGGDMRTAVQNIEEELKRGKRHMLVMTHERIPPKLLRMEGINLRIKTFTEAMLLVNSIRGTANG